MTKVVVRPMCPEDVGIVQALLEQDNWPRRSSYGWQWAIDDNPARVQMQAPTGWVLTSDDAVVGCLLNVPHLYFWNGEELPAATCSYFYVDTPWRGQAAALMRAFFLQKNAKLFFSASANTFGAPFYRLYKSTPGQDPGANLNLIWLACADTVARMALQRLKLGNVPLLTSLLAAPLSVAVSAYARLSRKGFAPRTKVQARVSTVARSDIDGRFDLFWNRLRQEPGLHLERSAQTVYWRMSDPDILEDLGLIVLEGDDGAIVGMAMLMNRSNYPGATPRAIVLDWCLLGDCTVDDSNALLQGALHWAQQRKLPMLDARRITGRMGRWLLQAQPMVRTLAPDTHWTKTPLTELAQCISTNDGWSSVNVDGDEWINLADYQVRPGRLPWQPKLV